MGCLKTWLLGSLSVAEMHTVLPDDQVLCGNRTINQSEFHQLLAPPCRAHSHGVWDWSIQVLRTNSCLYILMNDVQAYQVDCDLVFWIQSVCCPKGQSLADVVQKWSHVKCIGQNAWHKQRSSFAQT